MTPVTHLAPKHGQIVTPCCGKTLAELPHKAGHRLTSEPERCSCVPGDKPTKPKENFRSL